jgi:hypothetical protein
MAFSEFEQKRYEKPVKAYIEERRPPPNIRKELDLGYRFTNQSVEMFEIRPAWRRPGEYLEQPIAKATFVKTERIWKIYWQRADLKWHRYDPNPSASTIEEFLTIVEQDEYACFHG